MRVAVIMLGGNWPREDKEREPTPATPEFVFSPHIEVGEMHGLTPPDLKAAIEAALERRLARAAGAGVPGGLDVSLVPGGVTVDGQEALEVLAEHLTQGDAETLRGIAKAAEPFELALPISVRVANIEVPLGSAEWRPADPETPA